MDRTDTVIEELLWEELHPEVKHTPKTGNVKLGHP